MATRELALKKTKTYAALDFTFRAIVPGIVALAVFGAVGDQITALPQWLAWVPEAYQGATLEAWIGLNNLSFGFFAFAAIIGFEVKDKISKQKEEYKIQNKQVLAKNRAVSYLLVGVAVMLIHLVAIKAMVFLFSAGASSLLALVFEKKRNEWHAQAEGIVI